MNEAAKLNVMKLFNYLQKPNVNVVFDIDGTMGVYLFGELRHCVEECSWEGYVKSAKPYTNDIAAVPQIQKFIQRKTFENGNSIYVCSVSQAFEREEKFGFVTREYPTIPSKNIYFVDSKEEKLKLLKNLSTGSPESAWAIVDDTVKTLDNISEHSEFITVHNSVFMLYE